MLILAEFYNMVGKISQLEVRVAVVPGKQDQLGSIAVQGPESGFQMYER